jgi:hypothetical protein
MKVEKASSDDFERVYPLLSDYLNPGITKNQWKNLFVDRWNFQEGYCGYKLLDGSEVVGFIAYILSGKQVNGQWEKFCNISSWIVKKEYRNSSIDLLYPLQDLPGCTCVSFTPSIGAYQVETKLFKFKILDRYEAIIPALPSLPGLLNRKCDIVSHTPRQPGKIVAYLSDYEKKIFQDHVLFDCDHLVVITDRGNLYLIFKKVYKRHLPFAKLYFAGDPGIFLKHLDEIRFRVPLALKTAGLVIDSRFLNGRRFRLAKNKAFYMPMLYRSDRLQPHEVDYLYSEFFLLGL